MEDTVWERKDLGYYRNENEKELRMCLFTRLLNLKPARSCNTVSGGVMLLFEVEFGNLEICKEISCRIRNFVKTVGEGRNQARQVRGVG